VIAIPIKFRRQSNRSGKTCLCHVAEWSSFNRSLACDVTLIVAMELLFAMGSKALPRRSGRILSFELRLLRLDLPGACVVEDAFLLCVSKTNDTRHAGRYVGRQAGHANYNPRSLRATRLGAYKVAVDLGPWYRSSRRLDMTR
jgi:hypothetical protein